MYVILIQLQLKPPSGDHFKKPFSRHANRKHVWVWVRPLSRCPRVLSVFQCPPGRFSPMTGANPGRTNDEYEQSVHSVWQIRSCSDTGRLLFLRSLFLSRLTKTLQWLLEKWMYFTDQDSCLSWWSCWAPLAAVKRSTWMWGLQSLKRGKQQAVCLDFLLHYTSRS